MTRISWCISTTFSFARALNLVEDSTRVLCLLFLQHNKSLPCFAFSPRDAAQPNDIVDQSSGCSDKDRNTGGGSDSDGGAGDSDGGGGGNADGGGSGDEGAPAAESGDGVWGSPTSNGKRKRQSKSSSGGRGRIDNAGESEKVGGCVGVSFAFDYKA